MIHDVLVLEMVKFKLNDRNMWSEMGRSVEEQLKRETPDQGYDPWNGWGNLYVAESQNCPGMM